MHEVNFVARADIYILDVLAFNRIYSLAIFRSLTIGIRKGNFAHSLPTQEITMELLQCSEVEWVVCIGVCEGKCGGKNSICLALANDGTARTSSATLGQNR